MALQGGHFGIQTDPTRQGRRQPPPSLNRGGGVVGLTSGLDKGATDQIFSYNEIFILFFFLKRGGGGGGTPLHTNHIFL